MQDKEHRRLAAMMFLENALDASDDESCKKTCGLTVWEATAAAHALIQGPTQTKGGNFGFEWACEQVARVNADLAIEWLMRPLPDCGGRENLHINPSCP